MAASPADNPEIVTGNSPGNSPPSIVYSYNLDDTKTPGEMKVRWKVRIETGQRAEHWNRKQADAIREFLEWANSCRQHRD